MRSLSSLILLTLLIAYAPSAHAHSCYEIFQEPVSRAMETDPVVQLRFWEALANTFFYRKPTDSVAIPFKMVPPSEVGLTTSSATPPALLRFMLGATNGVRWLMHPLNTAPSVPYHKESTDGSIKGYYSASRSMFVMLGKGLYSFKLPTNSPHLRGELQPSKADMHNDAILSMRRSEHVREVDRELQPHDSLFVLTEMLSVAANRGGNGFSVRDLRPLQDGHYYLPAFSIAYVGAAIARFHNVEFSSFWQRAYAEKVGEAKALLLLRYGLQMKTPNAQNWLVQLDKNFMPTGKIFLRDIADSSFVEFIAAELGFGQKMQKDHESKFDISLRLMPESESSFWQMDKGAVSSEILQRWYMAHDAEYVRTIVGELKIREEIYDVERMYAYLHTDAGRRALRDYAEQRRRP